MEKTGDEAFLTQLEAHKKILYKVARLYCADPDDRQDLVQDIVIQLWRSYGRFDGRSAFSTWMYRVALNVAISWVRDDRRRGRHTVPLDDALLDTTLADRASDELPAESRRLLDQLLGSLGDLDRALILLYLEGHDHQSIGEVLGLSSTNVATKIGRIKSRLQDAAA